ncbi:farnesyl-diphosphate farnesyltransferase 1 [Salpingoeca rosetta]|uniref:Squalene synthase n=1 Tax=Salpingoeca rosetta (strain ATCC 50818 / BSB-021) TaxID=946362 RepID=F2UCY9_SALR5|nr:farnesyl-diphosphate farnesyltransferase 1 [Salpingoeca rosetta]EGD74484.1 farnesyl-diphosphate farnesyltransferase 1 [Salpingoeca rosetta]|eukprot:XP_004992741.1 farnesyl-diphosphate farnesyltransferase 1 [Salpingoeca rosetta]
MSALAASLTHPTELFQLINFQFFGGKERLFPARAELENTPSMRRCDYYLCRTSRSFSAVIRALDAELRPAISIFYLVLRGLDTVEDDMSLDKKLKHKLLTTFHEKLYDPQWNFDGSGPNEKDRDLLVEFHVVTQEFLALDKKFQVVIADICKRMGHGMAEFIDKTVETVDDYNLYCHYVAGLVGIGLSKLFSASGLESAEVGVDEERANSMGLFLQKTNIIRDYLEDLEEGRTWWPRQVWSLYGTKLSDFASPDCEAGGLACLNHLVADALQHVPDCFVYMSRLRTQSVFNFCAIPQVMAIATLDLCYNNKQVLKRNVKIRKGTAVSLMMKATSLANVIDIFVSYSKSLQSQGVTTDPTYGKLSSTLDTIFKRAEQAKTMAAATDNLRHTRTEAQQALVLSPSVTIPVGIALAGLAAYYYTRHTQAPKP